MLLAAAAATVFINRRWQYLPKISAPQTMQHTNRVLAGGLVNYSILDKKVSKNVEISFQKSGMLKKAKTVLQRLKESFVKLFAPNARILPS